MLDKMKWTSIAYSILYIVAGIFLLLYPGQASLMFCDLFGIALIVYGIIDIVVYFLIDIRVSLFRNDFSAGIIKILIGVMVIYHKDVFQQTMPFLLAVAIIASGFSKLQDGVDAARIGYPNSGLFVGLAIVSIVFGIVIMLNLVKTQQLMLQVSGAALLYSGISDLYTTLSLSGKIRKFLDQLEHPEHKTENVRPEPKDPPQETSTAAYVDWNTTASGMEAIREELSPKEETEKESEAPAPEDGENK